MHRLNLPTSRAISVTVNVDGGICMPQTVGPVNIVGVSKPLLYAQWIVALSPDRRGKLSVTNEKFANLAIRSHGSITSALIKS
jgi:hypothetical protein